MDNSFIGMQLGKPGWLYGHWVATPPNSGSFVRGKFLKISILILLIFLTYLITYHPEFFDIDTSLVTNHGMICESADRVMYPLDPEKVDFLKQSEKIYQHCKSKRKPYLEKPEHNVWFDPTPWDIVFPSFNCPFVKERIGRIGDGGKWVCGLQEIKELSKSRPCIVYSFGVGTESSFEKDILEQTNCSVFAFDPTVYSISINAEEFPGRLTFERIGIGGSYYSNLSSIMNRLGHSWIDILKMDIEEAEYTAMETILKDFPDQLPFGGLNLEIHIPNLDSRINSEAKYFEKVTEALSWFETLENRGLRPFQREMNTYSIRISHKPLCAEYAFFNLFPYKKCLGL